MTHARVKDFDPNFVRPGWSDLDVFHRQRLLRFPGDCSLRS